MNDVPHERQDRAPPYRLCPSLSYKRPQPTDFSSKPDLFLTELNGSGIANTAGPLLAINTFPSLLGAGNGKKVTYTSTGVAHVPDTLDLQTLNLVPYAAS